MPVYPGRETGSAQVTAAVQAALAPVARYVALVARANPLGSADELLARPDIRAELVAALDAARQAAAAVVVQQWEAAGAPDAPVRAHLLADIDRQYGDLPHLLSLIRHAHASVPQRKFVPGITQPGASPAIEAGDMRAAVVRDAILGFARYAALRSRLTVAVAVAAARTARTLQEAHVRRAKGERVLKRWECRHDGKACYWCQRLDGVTIGLEDSFLPYLGSPVDLTGHGHPTQPPKPYRGELQGPGLHPHCGGRCRLVVVREGERETGPVTQAPSPAPRFITASQIRAMPEPRYKALTAFLRAALHELGLVLRRLVKEV